MRIASLVLADFECYPAAALDLAQARLVCLAGPNESGKSAVLDAVRWALLGRGRLGGARDEVVRRGAKTCRVELQVADGPAVTRTPSRGSHSLEALVAALGVRDKGALEAALDAAYFAALAPAERRRLAFRVAGGEVTAERLREAGVTDPDLAQIALARGFKAAEQAAAEKKRALNREAEELERGAVPDAAVEVGGKTVRLSALDPAKVRAQLAGLRAERDRKRDLLAAAAGASEAEREAARAASEEAERVLAGAAAAVPPLKAALQAAERDEQKSVSAVRFAGEERRLKLQMARRDLEGAIRDGARADGAAKLAQARAEQAKKAALNLLPADPCGPRCAQHCPENPEAARSRAHAEAGARVAEAQTADQAAHAAAARLAELEPIVARLAGEQAAAEATFLPLLTATANARTQLAAATREHARAETALVAARARIVPPPPAMDRQAVEAEVAALDARLSRGEEIATAAAGYYAGAVARREAEARRASARLWEAQEHALRPDGAMAGLVAGPLAKLREALQAVASRLLARPLALGDDWTFSYDGAPWEYASASTRWRIGAAAALALASVSGLRWVALDEASICVGRTRDALLRALLDLTGPDGLVDQVWLCTSRGEGEDIKAPPAALADAVRVLRVGGGIVERVEERRVPA